MNHTDAIFLRYSVAEALDIHELLRATTSSVEFEMRQIVSNSLVETPDLSADALSCINDAGFRMLSTLFRVSYEVSGNSFERMLPLCAGIELLQVSTLLIDDILDDAATRNGRSSVVSRRGMKGSVVVGIVLSSLGMQTMAAFLRSQSNLNQAFRVLELFEQVQHEVYVGQFLDLYYTRKTDLPESSYFLMISKTTAAFIKAPLVAGAMLGGASVETIALLDSIGQNLGLAYQVRDDVIDYLGDPDCTGKPRFGDLRQRRMRLPIVHALNHLDKDECEWLRRLLAGQEAMSSADIERVSVLLGKAGSMEYAMEKTKELCQAARNSLVGLPPQWSRAMQQIEAIADLTSSFE